MLWRDEPEAASASAPLSGDPSVFLAAIRHLFALFCGSFGDPAHLANQKVFTRPDHAAMSIWIASLERAVRILLFLMVLFEAPRLPAPPPLPSDVPELDPREALARRIARTPPAEPCYDDPGPPETWTAPFCLMPTGPSDYRIVFDPADSDMEEKIAAWEAWRTGPAPREEAALPLVPSLPLARRLEALLRILNDPRRATQRVLARFMRAPTYLPVIDPDAPPLREQPGRGCPCSTLLADMRQALKSMQRAVWPASLWPPEPLCLSDTS